MGTLGNYSLFLIEFVHSKKKLYHHLFTLMSFQTHKTSFILLIQIRAVRYGQKIYITIFDCFFDFNHDFDTNRHALSSYLFCTSYLSCTSCFTLLYSITHFTLISFFTYIYIYICSCVVLLLYNLYYLHCPLSGTDLIYISLLIIPCIIYHVTDKETLTFTVINAFCVNLKHISKGNQLDLSQKVVTCL